MAALSEGDRASMLGPGGRFAVREGDRHLFLGDATALGLFGGMIGALPAGAAFGAVEVPEEDADGAARIVPELRVVHSSERPGQALLQWLSNELDSEPDVAYLYGHAQTTYELRASLRSSTALSRRQICTRAFWATGRRGL